MANAPTQHVPASDGLDQSPDRRRLRHDAKKQRIVSEAWALAHEHGLAAIPLRDLATQVDLQQPSLYAYFDSKLAIYEAMYTQAIEALRDEYHAQIWPEDPDEALVAFVECSIRFTTDDVIRHQLLFQRSIPGFKPPARAQRALADVRQVGWERLQAVGVHDLATADIFTAIVSGLTNQQAFNDPKGDRWLSIARRTIEMYLVEVRRPPRLSSKRNNSTPASTTNKEQ